MLKYTLSIGLIILAFASNALAYDHGYKYMPQYASEPCKASNGTSSYCQYINKLVPEAKLYVAKRRIGIWCNFGGCETEVCRNILRVNLEEKSCYELIDNIAKSYVKANPNMVLTQYERKNW